MTKQKPGKKTDRKPLVDYIRGNKDKIEAYGNLSEHFDDSEITRISVDEILSLKKKGEKIVLVDVRSEAEYEEDHLPGAENFPILDNKERDEVGFLYKQFSPQSAYFLATEFAEKKMDKIKEFAAGCAGRKVFVYCWRGGGRSGVFSVILKRLGIDVVKVKKGYKGYRNIVYNTFYQEPEKIKFIPLFGLTGCGKTQIIESFGNDIPIFNIEAAATHAASLFGKVRFDITKTKPVTSQIEFENKLFQEFIKPVKDSSLPFLTEGESKKINKFQLPNPLFDVLVNSPSIKVVASLENRVDRIVKEYFSGNGLKECYNIVANSDYFKRFIGKEKVSWLLKLLEENRLEEFSEWFLVHYYDEKYGTKYSKNVIAEVDSANIEQAKKEIVEIMKRYN